MTKTTVVRALNRFGLGARIDDTAEIDDPRAWLASQVDAGPSLRAAPGGSADPAGLLADRRSALREDDAEMRREVARRIVAHTSAEALDVLRVRLVSRRPFVERWVSFWANHFCVSAAAKLQTRLVAGAYEREAIRPHVFGSFEEMLSASARHPAMLTYLDNAQSIGPTSLAARRGGRRRSGAGRGLNENYARELLELHTVGVDAGYTQDDVVELARILTGWTVRAVGEEAGGARRSRRPAQTQSTSGDFAFAFVEAFHEPGPRTVMGRRYDDGGETDGQAVLRDLARHPATADFVAGKLARHFVADDPPHESVAALARVFQDTEGDLRQVAHAVIGLDAAWSADARKFRTPQDWLVAMLRAMALDEVPRSALSVLRALRHPLWSPPSPQGFSDLTRDWADPDGLMNRAELARTVAEQAERRGRGVPPARLLDLMDVAPDDPLPGLLADASIATSERLALGFASPAFQWR